MPAPRTVHVRLIPSTPVARRRYRLEVAAASDDVTRLEWIELAAWRALAGRPGRIAERVAAVVIVAATLALSVTAAPDADAAATGNGWAPVLALTPWLPACEHEDSSDCVGGGGNYLTRRVAPGAVCVEFPTTPADGYCTADAYPPAGAPEWVQLSTYAARNLARDYGGTVAGWAACAVTLTGPPELVCPGDGLPSDTRSS